MHTKFVFSIYQINLVYTKIKFCIYILYKMKYLPDFNTPSEHVIDMKTRINDNQINAQIFATVKSQIDA